MLINLTTSQDKRRLKREISFSADVNTFKDYLTIGVFRRILLFYFTKMIIFSRTIARKKSVWLWTPAPCSENRAISLRACVCGCVVVFMFSNGCVDNRSSITGTARGYHWSLIVPVGQPPSVADRSNRVIRVGGWFAVKWWLSDHSHNCFDRRHR